MRNIKGLKGLAVFAICLWGIVLATYAAQVKREGRGEDGKPRMIAFDGQCSSSSSSGSSSGGE